MVKRYPSKPIEGPSHQAESEIRQTVKLDQADNTPADSKSVGGSLVKLEDKAESTRVEKGKAEKFEVENNRIERDRVNSTTTPKKAKGLKSGVQLAKSPISKSIDPVVGEDDVTSLKSYYRG